MTWEQGEDNVLSLSNEVPSSGLNGPCSDEGQVFVNKSLDHT
jgi:hypothetical protein